MPDDDGISRRKFLGAAAAAATAGCIGEDDTSQSTDEPNTPNSTPTGTSSNDSNENSTDSEKDNSSTTDNPQDDELEDNESQVETDLQESLSEEGMWLEIGYDQLTVPDSTVDRGNDISFSQPEEGETLFSYDQLVQLLGDDIYLDINGVLPSDDPGEQGDIESYFFVTSELEQEHFDEPYREVLGYMIYEDSNGGDRGHKTVEWRAFEDGALERLLTENVEGVSDYSEDIDEELLEYAQS